MRKTDASAGLELVEAATCTSPTWTSSYPFIATGLPVALGDDLLGVAQTGALSGDVSLWAFL